MLVVLTTYVGNEGVALAFDSCYLVELASIGFLIELWISKGLILLGAALPVIVIVLSHVTEREIRTVHSTL